MKRIFLIILLFLIFLYSANAQIVNTIAGGYLGEGRTAKSIGIVPQNQVIDKAGNIYIAEPLKHIVRKLSVNGIYSIAAGNGISGYSGDGGPATAAQLKNPYDIAIDSAGNLFIADSYDSRIRKVDTSGIITTFAGNGTLAFSGDGGPATAAALNGPNGLATDNKGNLYIADFSNVRVRKVDSSGIITTIAGDGNSVSSGDGGPATLARFAYPLGVFVNTTGEIFVTDVLGNKIRKIAVNGIINTIAGNGSYGFSGDAGLAVNAQLSSVDGRVVVDTDGSFYIPDSQNNRVRKVSSNGIINTVAGNGGTGFNGNDTPARLAPIHYTSAVAINRAGNLSFASDYRVVTVSSDNILHTTAGNGNPGFSGDSFPAVSSQLYAPVGAAEDISGNIFIADQYRIRKISPVGIMTTIAGNGQPGNSGDSGSATLAHIDPYRMIGDNKGNLYVASYSLLRKISSAGVITTIAGSTSRGCGGDGGPATAATLRLIEDLAIDTAGNLFLADRPNFRIRRIAPDGIISTIAGNGTEGYSGDGGPATAAELGSVTGIKVDRAGNIYISDVENNRVRKVDAQGIITTFAGDGTFGFSGDGAAATSARFQYPGVLNTDTLGNVYIYDQGNNRIRKVNTKGIITTIAGGGSSFAEGALATDTDIPSISFALVEPSGNIIFGERNNHRVRKISGLVLPVNSLQFSAAQRDKSIVTVWNTASEINTSYYTIERSIDGFHFIAIATVKAVASGSNNNQCSFPDNGVERLNTKILYYRLRIIDKDNKTTYSDIVKVLFRNKGFVFSLSPNPANNIVYVVGEKIRLIVISDASGNTVLRKAINNAKTAIDIAILTKGMYTVKAFDVTGTERIEKLIVQ